MRCMGTLATVSASTASTVWSRVRGSSLGQVEDPIGAGVARGDVVDGDAVGGQLGRQGLGEADHAGPVDVGEQQVVDRLLDRYRGDVDDAAPLPGAHGGQRRPDQAHGAQQGELVGCQPGLVVEIVKVAGGRAAVVGDQDVDATEAVQRLGDQVADLGVIGQVGFHGEHVYAGGGCYLVRGCRQARGVPGTDDYPRPFTGQFQRAGFAQPPAGGGDERDTVLQSQVHSALLCSWRLVGMSIAYGVVGGKGRGEFGKWGIGEWGNGGGRRWTKDDRRRTKDGSRGGCRDAGLWH